MTCNIFAETLKIVSTCKETENGATAFSTTGNACVDLFAEIGALRNGGDYHSRLFTMIERAYAENPLLLAKILFYARDVRGGLGEREVFRTAIYYCAHAHPEIVKENLIAIPEFGRWDDLFALIGTPLEKNMWEFIRWKFEEDEKALRGESKSKVSLLAKWMPSADTSSKETRALAYLCASNLDMTVYEYKRRVRALRRHLNLLETKMSSKKWGEIDYSSVPSQAHLRHTKAFLRNDNARYTEFINNVDAGKKEMKTATLYPYEIVERLKYKTEFALNRLGYFEHEYVPDVEANKPLEAMWKNLPNYVKDSNIIIMADTSGSMTGRPMNISTSLAIYFAERNKGVFGGLYMTFDSNPRLITIDQGKSLLDRYLQLREGPWGGSTNLYGAFNLLLDVAVKSKAKSEDMPKSLVVITDMEINSGGDDHKMWNTIVDDMREKYAQAGYELPNIIFWNVASRHETYLARCDYKGVQLVSGSSPSVFEAVIGFTNGMTPIECVEKILGAERYSGISV